MSDRREDVARAFWEARESYISEAQANAVCRGTDGDSYPDCVERIYELASLAGADAALAAVDAEPTEAEVAAAADAYLDSMPEHIALDCAFVYPGAIRAALTAFLAARTARPGGQGK